jgi:hypothetical protein
MKLRTYQRENEMFKEIQKIGDESRRIYQILTSEDCRIDLLKQEKRKKKNNKNINYTLPNLIYNQGNINLFKPKGMKKNILSKTFYSTSKQKDRKKTPFNKNQTRTFFDNNNCTYDYDHHLEKMKKLNELSKLNTVIGNKKETEYKKMPLNYKNLEKDFEYVHNQLYDDYDKLERYKKLDDILIGDKNVEPYETKNYWKPLKIRDYYLKKSLIFHKMNACYMYRNNNNGEYNILKNYINKIEND